MFPDNLCEYPIYKALYRKNNFGQPSVWFCRKYNDSNIIIYHGIVGKTTIVDIVNAKNPTKEVNSRINAKRKIGYKYISELKDNISLPVEGEILQYLNAYLPDYRTTIDGSVLPMKAKVYDNTNNRIFNKCPGYIGQWKINGLRCFISAITNNNIFRPIKLRFQSCEGTYWDSLDNLQDYLLTVIDQSLISRMVEEHYILDGELYLPGHTVNEINHFVKDPTCPENKLLQYWCYDVAIENTVQSKRMTILCGRQHDYIKTFTSKEQHLNNKEQFIVLPNWDVTNNEEAVTSRDNAIDLGFEGLILRNPDVEYQYGKRNMSMIKFKRSTDGKFKIIDIYPEGNKRQNVPLFLCKNDINEETFECHIGGSIEYQQSILKDKDKFIGRYMFVEYGERSGVKELPFHIKNTYIID